jgi:hypothetical protein
VGFLIALGATSLAVVLVEDLFLAEGLAAAAGLLALGDVGFIGSVRSWGLLGLFVAAR